MFNVYWWFDITPVLELFDFATIKGAKTSLHLKSPVFMAAKINRLQYQICIRWQQSEHVVLTGRSLTPSSWDLPLSIPTVAKPVSKNLETLYSPRLFTFYFDYLLVGSNSGLIGHCYTHTRLTALFMGLPRLASTRKAKTNLNFTEARDSEWQWHQLGRMQVCTSLQTDNHASTPPLSFFTGQMPFLPPNQQHQSTEGTLFGQYWYLYSKWTDYTKYLKYINGQQRLKTVLMSI